MQQTPLPAGYSCPDCTKKSLFFDPVRMLRVLGENVVLCEKCGREYPWSGNWVSGFEAEIKQKDGWERVIDRTSNPELGPFVTLVPFATKTAIRNEEDRRTETGAVRSKVYSGDAPSEFPARLDLILRNAKGLRALARTYGEGFLKYGRDNRLKGFKESVYLQHALDHLIEYASGDQSEDHLTHAAWNLLELRWVKEEKPELMDVTGPDPGPDRKAFDQIAEAALKARAATQQDKLPPVIQEALDAVMGHEPTPERRIHPSDAFYDGKEPFTKEELDQPGPGWPVNEQFARAERATNAVRDLILFGRSIEIIPFSGSTLDL